MWWGPSGYEARMPMIARVLDSEPVQSLADYLDRGGGRGLEAARRMGPEATVEEVMAAGLRGRGGAGFPTGRKWATVAGYRSPILASTVVVNASEGEPGSFKDRTLLRRNPFKVLEGALIAALAVGADGVIVAVKGSFAQERDRLRAATKEVASAGWSEGVALSVFEGPPRVPLRGGDGPAGGPERAASVSSPRSAVSPRGR